MHYNNDSFEMLNVSFFLEVKILTQEMSAPRAYITFCGFPWVETSTAGRVYDLCVYYMTGAPEGSPKVVLCGFMFFLWRSRESNLRPLVYKA